MTEKKLNILIVHNYYQIPGGEDTVVANEKHMLEKNGHMVHLYTRTNKELNHFSVVQRLALPFKFIFNLETYKDISGIIKDKNIDIVHVHNTLMMISPSVYYAALQNKVPVVQTVHNFRLLCPGAAFYRDGNICEDCAAKGLGCAIRHRCYRNSRFQTLACVISTWIHRMLGIYGKLNYICLTEFNKEKLLQLKQIKKDRVYVKPNFVVEQDADVKDRKDFVFAGRTESYHKKNQILYAGRIEELKGVRLLLKAWKDMGDGAPVLVMCGIGSLYDYCMEYIKENKIKKIAMMGLLSNSQIKNLMKESKAVILPTQWYEGFPMTIVEAFSVGTPVICSDFGNCASLVIDGVNGYKIETNNSEGIKEAVKMLLQNDGMEDKVLEIYKGNYTENINYGKLMNIYGSAKL